MANYKTLSNDEAKQITEGQSEQNENFQRLKENLASRKLGFNYDRNIGFVGVNPKQPDTSYTMVAAPTFTEFDFASTPSHTAASIISYYTGDAANHIAAVAEISHNPLQIASLTLLEVGKDGTVVETMVDRKSLDSQSAQEIGKRMSVAHLDTPTRKALDVSVDKDDQMTMAAYVMNTLLSDSYASPLYPDGGQKLKADSVISSKFSNALSFRASLFDLGFEVTICTSTSSNACSSCSSTLTIDL